MAAVYKAHEMSLKRVVDPATGTTLAGPANELVKYTSTNAEQNLRTATRRISDGLFRELRESGR